MLTSSTMFMWGPTIGDRIKSDLRFNKLLTWNTFPRNYRETNPSGSGDRKFASLQMTSASKGWDRPQGVASECHVVVRRLGSM
jgi:hypothetical protein